MSPVAEQAHLPGPSPAGVVLLLLLAHGDRLSPSGPPCAGRSRQPSRLQATRPERVRVATPSPSRPQHRTGRGQQPATGQHRCQPPRRARPTQNTGHRGRQRPQHLHDHRDRISARRDNRELGSELRGRCSKDRQDPLGDRHDPAQPAPHRRSRHVQQPRDRPMPRPAGLGQQRRPDHRGRVRPAQQHTGRQQHLRASASPTPAPAGLQPTRPADHPLPCPPPRPQNRPRTRPPCSPTAPNAGRSRPPRCPALPLSRVHSNAPRRPLRVLQDKRKGRRPPTGHVLTLTSHTNNRKTPNPYDPEPPADQPTMTRSSSGR